MSSSVHKAAVHGVWAAAFGVEGGVLVLALCGEVDLDRHLLDLILHLF